MAPLQRSEYARLGGKIGYLNLRIDAISLTKALTPEGKWLPLGRQECPFPKRRKKKKEAEERDVEEAES